MATHAEGSLTKQVATWLKSLQERGVPLFWEHRSGSGGFAYKQGLPDMFLVVGDKHVEVELKAPGGRRSPMQDKWKARFEAMGTPYVCPTSLAELQQYLAPFLSRYSVAQGTTGDEWWVLVLPNFGLAPVSEIRCRDRAEAESLYDYYEPGASGISFVQLKQGSAVVKQKGTPPPGGC